MLEQKNNNTHTVSAAAHNHKRERAGIALSAPETLSDIPLKFQPLQLKVLDLGGHGTATIPDDGRWDQLTPDQPEYGNTAPVNGSNHNEPAGSSMKVLLSPNHGQGGSPNALNNVFNLIPTKGDFKLQVNNQHKAEGTNMYIKGHLLNDNLGGPGTGENLYPITHQANMDHSNMVEEPLKTHVNSKGGIAYYEVTVQQGGVKQTGMYNGSQEDLIAPECDFNTRTVLFNAQNNNLLTSDKVIRSRWKSNATQDGKNQLTAPPTTIGASTFDLGKVKLAPRRSRDKIFDETIQHIAIYIATKTKASTEQWLMTIHGIGNKGANLLLAGEDYTGLSKGDKTTFSKSFGLLKKLIEENYGLLYQKAQLLIKEIDDGTSEYDLEDDPQELISIANKLVEMDKAIDQITSGIGSLSLGSDDPQDSGMGFVNPFLSYQWGSSSSKYPQPEQPSDDKKRSRDVEMYDYEEPKFGQPSSFGNFKGTFAQMPSMPLFGQNSSPQLSFSSFTPSPFGFFQQGPNGIQQQLATEIQQKIIDIEKEKSVIDLNQFGAKEYVGTLDFIISLLQTIDAALKNFIQNKDQKSMETAINCQSVLTTLGRGLKTDIKQTFS